MLFKNIFECSSWEPQDVNFKSSRIICLNTQSGFVEILWKKITVTIIAEAVFFVLVSKLVYLLVLFCLFIKSATDQTGPPPGHSGRNRGFVSQSGMYKVYKILLRLTKENAYLIMLFVTWVLVDAISVHRRVEVRLKYPNHQSSENSTVFNTSD